MRHGTRSAYVQGCRCTRCVEADHAWQADYRQLRKRLGIDPGGLIDASATIALIRFLVDEGATSEWIRLQARIGKGTVSNLRAGSVSLVRKDTARKVEWLAQRVGSGELHPPNYARARQRQLDRERRRVYRQAG